MKPDVFRELMAQYSSGEVAMTYNKAVNSNAFLSAIVTLWQNRVHLLYKKCLGDSFDHVEEFTLYGVPMFLHICGYEGEAYFDLCVWDNSRTRVPVSSGRFMIKKRDVLRHREFVELFSFRGEANIYPDVDTMTVDEVFKMFYDVGWRP